MKALKAFIKKAFEAPQRSENKNLKLIFLLIQLSEMHRAERIKTEEESGVCIAFVWRVYGDFRAMFTYISMLSTATR